MNKTELLNKCARSGEERVLLARALCAAGKLLMQDHILLVTDEEQLLEGAQKQAAGLWRRANA